MTAELTVLIAGLSYAIERESTYPSRPDLFQRLRNLEKSARLLMVELADLQILALLLDGGRGIAHENEMYHALKDVAARTARVISRPRKQGRGKLYPKSNTGPNPMEHCALVAGALYRRGKGRWPGNKNPDAHQLCEALWKAAGGAQRAGWGKSGSVVVWGHYLKAAKRYRAPHPAGQQIDRLVVSAPSAVNNASRQFTKFPDNFYNHPRSIARRGKKKAD